MVGRLFFRFLSSTNPVYFSLISSSGDKCELTPSIHFSYFNFPSNSEIPIVMQDLIDINEMNIFTINYHRLRC